MNRSEVIKLFETLKSAKPVYFENMSKEKKLSMVDEWTSSLLDYDFNSVLNFSLDFVRENNMFPFPREIIAAIKKDDWKQFTVSDGNRILYGDALIHFIGLKNWSDVIPDDVLDQMEYDPSVNDEEWTFKRNEALKIALEIQGMLRG